MLNFNQYPALVLNADYQPLSYSPLSLWPVQETIKSVFSDRVSVVAEYDTIIHSAGNFEMFIPSVIALKEYSPKAYREPVFTRQNVFLRDDYTCQYCGNKFKSHDLTFDHVIPRCKGGQTTWTNIVSACSSCNLKKGGKDLKDSGMVLLKPIRKPTRDDLLKINYDPKNFHKTWRDFLYWNVELEK